MNIILFSVVTELQSQISSRLWEGVRRVFQLLPEPAQKKLAVVKTKTEGNYIVEAKQWNYHVRGT